MPKKGRLPLPFHQVIKQGSRIGAGVPLLLHRYSYRVINLSLLNDGAKQVILQVLSENLGS